MHNSEILHKNATIQKEIKQVTNDVGCTVIIDILMILARHFMFSIRMKLKFFYKYTSGRKLKKIGYLFRQNF